MLLTLTIVNVKNTSTPDKDVGNANLHNVARNRATQILLRIQNQAQRRRVLTQILIFSGLSDEKFVVKTGNTETSSQVFIYSR